MRNILTIVSSERGGIDNNLLIELKHLLAIDDTSLIAVNEGKVYHFYHEQIPIETQ